MERLRRARAGVRSGLNRTKSRLTELLARPQPSAADVQVAMDYLVSKRQPLSDLDRSILDETPEDAMEAEVSAAMEYEEGIEEAISRARLFLTQPQNVMPDRSQSSAGHFRTVQFPKLQIPSFSGKLSEWHQFWEHFDVTIHSNEALSPVEKFKYLATYLTDAAKRAVEGLRISGDTYPSAIKILKDRFGRSDLLSAEHIDRLLELRPIPTAQHVEQLRHLYDEVTMRVAALDALGIGREKYAVILCRVLVRCLPEKLCVSFRQRRRTETSLQRREDGDGTIEEIDDLLSFLKVQVETREEVALSHDKAPHVPRTLTSPSRAVPLRPATASALSATRLDAQNHSGASQAACPLCLSTEHRLESCAASVPPEEKRNRIFRTGRCFKCGKPGHISRRCGSAAQLSCSLCRGHHLTILWDVQNPLTQPQTSTSSSAGSALVATQYVDDASMQPDSHISLTTVVSVVSTSTTNVCPRRSGVAHLQTATVWASGPAGKKQIRALLDTGSQQTFIRRDLLRDLRCEIDGEEEMPICSFASSHHPKSFRCERVRVRLHALSNVSSFVDVEALGMEDVCKVFTPPLDETTTQAMWQYGLDLADTSCTHEIGVLIGSDHYCKAVTGRVERLSDTLTAVETVFGWVVQGVERQSQDGTACMISVGSVSCDCDHFDHLDPSEMWRLDSLGIVDPDSDPKADIALALFSALLDKSGGRYVVPLMVNGEGLPPEANNREIATQRLLSQLRRFHSAPHLLRDYDTVIREYFSEHHAERVEQASAHEKNVYYMPHHAVIRQDAVTTKLRVVFDASSHRAGQPSLNSILMKGPKINADLLHLLLTFRCFPVVLTADIRKAYLQILIRPQDRDLLRFLWVSATPVANEEPRIEEWRMTRVPFGATSSPFLLAATLQHHFDSLSAVYQATVPRLKTGFYVDDMVVGCMSEGDAMKVYDDACQILKEAGMEIRKWTSNSEALREAFLEDGISYDDASSGDPVVKVLGILWNRSTDRIQFNVDRARNFAGSRGPTKRVLLKTFSMIYDPLGYLSPFVVTARLLFQDLWHKACPWDAPISEDKTRAWEAWKADLPHITQLQLRRCVLQSDQGENLEIHCFADASPRAYGTAVYVGIRPRNGHPFAHLLLARARLAPLKQVTLPRLELLACLLASRLYRHISAVNVLSMAPAYFWTDSCVALQWIRGDADRWPTFVRSRVVEITSSTRAEQWLHCSGKDNPADFLTRGISVTALENSSLWWEGPERLSSSDFDVSDACRDAKLVESGNPQTAESEAVTQPSSAHPVVGTTEWMSLYSYSTLSTLLRVTAWIIRFCNNCRRRLAYTSGPLTGAEITRAERVWLHRTQQEAFPSEISCLSNGKKLSPASSVRDLRPFLDDFGIMRVGGRLHQLPDCEQVKHPVLLPAKHRFTDLVVVDAHHRVLHAGVQDTLSQVRSKFWILRGRQATRRVLHTCLTCRKHHPQLGTAPTAPLPRERITESEPFGVVGVDFAGPLYLRGSSSSSKAYIVLFSCGVTRAVHLELSSSMNLPDFLLAFRRFISRRGMPSCVYSDNARTFHKCSAVLSLVAAADVQDFAAQRRIEWRFIIERAPWWGGWWERLMRTVKEALRRSLGRGCLTFEELTTTLCEVEAVVNSRPLTHVGTDAGDPEPLTPSHFLLGKRATSLPNDQAWEAVPSSGGRHELYQSLESVRKAKRKFWTQWKREYLLLLRSAHHGATAEETLFNEGDVVLVQEDRVRPPFWKVGRVTRVIRGRDGVVRACVVRLPNGSSVARPVQRLSRLEVDVQPTPGGDGVRD
ncbi:uncharacterized protein LOC135374554 [Ornithodoros turicata]|uniref:uncharacterized protein LOC135374554 n=1 Tax=Ornithodoros turicata TaxID=34597 RepID=UPI00313A3D02